MEKASQDLKNEHRLILVALDVMDKINELIRSEKEVESGDIRKMIDFLKLFADKCHHGKEEGFLFPALEKAGIPKEGGPISVMLYEHEKGREFIRMMQDSVSNESIQRKMYADASAAYVRLLRNHIEKENNVLFQIGDARLTPEQQHELLEQFESFEDEVIGKGKHHELHAILEDFEAKYLK